MDKYHSTERMLSNRRYPQGIRGIFIAITCAVIFGFIIGILIGRFATCPDVKPVEEKDRSYLEEGDKEIGKQIINNIKNENIRENLR